MALVKVVETMHNTKGLFSTLLKIYLQLRNALVKFLNRKSIIVLNIETKPLIKNGLGKNLIKSYLLIGKTNEDMLYLCFSPFSFLRASLNKIN